MQTETRGSYEWFDEPLAEYLMRFSEAEKRKYREGRDLLRLIPVLWPTGDNVVNEANHYSGNVVTRVGSTLVAMILLYIANRAAKWVGQPGIW